MLLNSRTPWLRVSVLLGAVAALAVIVVGTSSGRSTADKPTIAFVSQGTSNSWAAQLDAVAKKTADQLGVNLVYYNGQGDATKQLPELQRAIATKPDALVVVPLGQAADTGPVERAMAQGTPVILCDSMVNTDNYTSLVNPDPSTAAKPLAEWLAKRMHYKGNLLYIGGLPGNGTTILYDKGFNAVMKKYPNIKVVNGGNANYSISTAKQLTATALASGKSFGGTWGVGGEAATGSPSAIRLRDSFAASGVPDIHARELLIAFRRDATLVGLQLSAVGSRIRPDVLRQDERHRGKRYHQHCIDQDRKICVGHGVLSRSILPSILLLGSGSLLEQQLPRATGGLDHRLNEGHAKLAFL